MKIPVETNAADDVEIVVNGAARRVPAGISLAHLLSFLNIDGSRVAMERNREIVPKAAWDTTGIQPGDQLEIVWFVGGG